jgi:hypothetical protein
LKDLSISKKPSIYEQSGETKGEASNSEKNENSGQSMFSLLKSGSQSQSMMSRLKSGVKDESGGSIKDKILKRKMEFEQKKDGVRSRMNSATVKSQSGDQEEALAQDPGF